MTRSPTRPFSVALVAVALLACTTRDEGASIAGATRSRAGDTLVVRTAGDGTWRDAARLVPTLGVGEAGGDDSLVIGRVTALALAPDGRVLVTDGSGPVVRVFGAALRPLAIWSRDGAGPGELRNPDAGLAVLADGRTVVRDPGNARLQLLDAEGLDAGSWRVISGQSINRRAITVTGDTLVHVDVVDPSQPLEAWAYGAVRIRTDGTVLDTIPVPASRLVVPMLRTRVGGNTAERALPFAPAAWYAWHPAGGFVSADGDRYAVTLATPAGIVRMERDVAPVPVRDVEAAQERAHVTRALQWLDRNWQWDGPEVPSTKPFVSGLFTGTDGRVWVLREGEAVEADDPEHDPSDAFSVERRWRSALTFDVFEVDGTFLGTVAVPPALHLRPTPVFTADGVWSASETDAGVPRVVFHRLVVP